ncbi:MAG: phosphoadenylyl-sulfate reductase [Sulfurospirillum sp.]|nr:phosphoadenylyl-sulfate reductase [Sulfurospirillum sp.]
MNATCKEKIAQALKVLQEEIVDKNYRVTLGFSHQNEDVIAIDLAQKAGVAFDVFTLDTQKLFQESLAYQKEIEAFFNIKIKSFSATKTQIYELETKVGETGIFEDIALRKECCYVRKIEPLKIALVGYDGWISGIRQAQSPTRAEVLLATFDAQFGLFKYNPLVYFSDADVSDYMQKNALPQNALYAKGFKSIGCKPCTRAVNADEDIRAGRWWWEAPQHKECGLHLQKKD